MAINLKSLPSINNEDRGYIGWIPGWDYLSGKGRYNSNIHFDTWKKFYDIWGDNDIETNTVVNFYFSTSDSENENLTEVTLNLWVLHPRKGASRAIVIQSVKEDELEEVKSYLADHATQVSKWFQWAIS